VLGAFALTLLAALALVGWLVSHVLADTFVGHLDAGLDNWFAAHRTGWANVVSDVVTWLAETPTVIGLGLLACVCTRRTCRDWSDAMFVAAVVIGEVTVFVLVTALVSRDRPDVRMDAAPPTSSFPSGHTAASVALYGAMAVVAWRRVSSLVWRRVFVVLAVLVPLGVAVSRLYRGMHFPTDVVFGLLLGATWLAICTRLLDPGRDR
jgi:undecaprenyl-diphosphatase